MRRNATATLLLAMSGCASAGGDVAGGPPAARHLGDASDADAWSRLPRESSSLPIWARTTFESLPVTTALEVDLDAFHRTQNPLGRELTARLRCAVAEATFCAYAKEAALADLKRAGVDPETKEPSDLDRIALDFATRLTRAASTIRDDEVARLVEKFGLDDTVAIVHTIAYANFQDRLFLGLGLTSEPGGVAAPQRLRQAPDAVVPLPPRDPPKDASAAPPSPDEPQPAWSTRSFEEIQAELDRQKSRPPRVPEPDATRLARFPRPDRSRIARSAWGRVSRGYQPDLTGGWSEAMQSFTREAGLDEVFANSIFWVVTRTNDCFY